jgi:hypothetical protein
MNVSDASSRICVMGPAWKVDGNLHSSDTVKGVAGRRRKLKSPNARIVTCSKFHTEAPQILGATVKTFFAMAAWKIGFVHPRRIF